MFWLLTLSTLLWLPYYVWGVGWGNALLAQNRILAAAGVVTITVLIGFVGLHWLRRVMMPDAAASSANFRLFLILGTQLTAVLLIAIDSRFNWRAILAGLLVVTGAIVATSAIE